MEDKRYDPYTGYEIKKDEPKEDSTESNDTQEHRSYEEYGRTYSSDSYETTQPEQQTSGIALATMILGIIAVVCMISCCCTPLAIIVGIAAIICFVVTPKVNETRGNKAKAGLICGIVAIIGSIILITVFVVNIVLSSEFQNDMKEFNTNYDKYTEEMDDSI